MTCQNFWPMVGEGGKGRQGETRLPLRRNQKCDQRKSKALEIVFAKFCRQSSTRKINLDSSFEQICWLPLNWLILRQNEMQGTLLAFPSLLYWVSLPLPSASVRMVFRAYAEVITKFSRIHSLRFPIFFSNRAPLRAGVAPTLRKRYSMLVDLFSLRLRVKKSIPYMFFTAGNIIRSITACFMNYSERRLAKANL